MEKAKLTKLTLNQSNVRSLLLKGEATETLCLEYANKIRERCQKGEYEVDSQKGKTRVNAMVSAADYVARLDNSRHNTLLKAVKGS